MSQVSRQAATQIMDDPQQVLASRFGMKSFNTGQLEVINRLLAGRSSAAVFPTGGGKSLCYQLPSLMFAGTTLVVSPLLALMKDQCDALAARGIRAARLDSTLSAGEVSEVMRSLRSGECKLLYVAPERFFNERFRAAVSDLKIDLFAVDEAHCISRWGHNFRPDYLKLAEIARDLGAARVLALTATATPEVLNDICDTFGIEPHDAIRTPFHRNNLQLRTRLVTAKDRTATLVHELKTRAAGSTIVYVTLQKTAEEVAELLAAQGLDARPYHAGLNDELRADTQAWFVQSEAGIVVATIAFGMGIDKSNIRYVYHYNPPASLEAYAQEIGRAGRDGRDSVCEMFVVPEDRVVLENFAYGDTPTRRSVGKLIDLIAGQPETFHISHYQLSSETDIRMLVARTLLTYLELDGYLIAKSPRYETYKLKPTVTSRVMLDSLSGEPRQFMSGVLSSLTKGRTWFLLNMAVAAKRLNCPRDRIVKAVEYLSDRGWAEVEVSDLVHGYQKSRPIAEPKLLADELFKRCEQRERDELKRLDQVFELSRANSCMAGRLAEHFGERLAKPCGRCSYCLGQGALAVPAVIPRSIGNAALKAVDALSKKYPDHLMYPRDKARFLCGLTSPGMVRARLSRHEHFGICAEVPYATVLAAVS